MAEDDLHPATPIPLEEQLRLVARLDFRRAVELLAEKGIRLRNDRIRGREISPYFTLSKEQLSEYIRGHTGLAAWLLEQSYNQRTSEAPYMLEGPGGYEVGQFSVMTGRCDRRLHVSIDDAATDFALLRWDLPRYLGSSTREPDEPIVRTKREQ